MCTAHHPVLCAGVDAAAAIAPTAAAAANATATGATSGRALNRAR